MEWFLIGFIFVLNVKKIANYNLGDFEKKAISYRCI